MRLFRKRFEKPIHTLRREPIHRIITNQGPDPVVDREIVWRLHDDSGEWCASLAKDFLSLECTTYSSRDDFIERLAKIADAASQLIGASRTNRIGVRYLSRVVAPQFNRLKNLIDSDILGAVAREHFWVASDAILTAVTADTAEGKANFRWGFLSPRATFDPDALDAIEEPSWVFDIDVAITEPKKLTRAAVEEASRTLAERCYAIFRSLVTNEFLKAYGEELE